MSDETKKPDVVRPVISIPGLGAVPVVAVKLPDGSVALRHPSELVKGTPPEQTGGGGA